MNSFIVNGIEWRLAFVPSASSVLFRSDGSHTVGMTDANTHSVYIDENLQGEFLEKVLCHEICHCFCFSYNIKLDIEQEEYLANWVSMYGRKVIELLDILLSK